MASPAVGPCSGASQKFKGDSSELLDKLVEVCNTVKVVSNAKVVERELQPFCFDNAPPLPKAPRSPPNGRSPRSSPPKQQKAADACSPGGHRKTDPASCASSSCRASLESASNAKKPLSNKSNLVSLEPADDLAAVLRGSTNVAAQPLAAASVRACPGFFSSPRPCDIPMPTSTLLGKATLVKA